MLGLLVLGNTKAYSQDPCASEPPYPEWIAWTHEDCIEVEYPSGCVVEVCYCVRTVNSQKQYAIKSFKVISGCGSMSWSDLITTLPGEFAREITQGIPDCPSYALTASITSSVCWQVKNAAGPLEPPELYCVICPDASGYCVQVFRICKESNDPLVYSITLHSETSDSGECTEAPPTGPWEIDACYTVTPCEE